MASARRCTREYRTLAGTRDGWEATIRVRRREFFRARLCILSFASWRLEQAHQIRLPVLGHDANGPLRQVVPDDAFKGKDYFRPGEGELLKNVHNAPRAGPQLGIRGGVVGFGIWRRTLGHSAR